MYEAKVIADSLHPGRVSRLTTFEVVMPRWMLPDFNTHCRVQRNSESSRAKPPEKRIQELRADMYVPVFGSRVKGMGQGDDLTPAVQDEAQTIWRNAGEFAATMAGMLNELGADKSHVNRLLEPFVWQRVVATADEWENFLALRDHPDATPEFQTLARMMREARDQSEPRRLTRGEWHLPYVTAEEYFAAVNGYVTWPELIYRSVGRTAAISFDRALAQEDPLKSKNRARMLQESGHMSPFAHQARPATNVERYLKRHLRGSFVGPWTMLRKTIPNEGRFDLILKERENDDLVERR